MHGMALLVSKHPKAIAFQELCHDHNIPFVPPEEADILIAAGGDGHMLQTLRHFPDKPVYGLNFGSIGFLMNTYTFHDFPLSLETFMNRIKNARAVQLYPLRMDAYDIEGRHHSAYALNEVALLRKTVQAAKIRITVDGKVRLNELICDGILVATPAGSTAYNFSAHGPIIPIMANLLALTPVSAFRPRRWRGALLPNTSVIDFTILNEDYRLVSASADDQEIVNVVKVSITQDTSKHYTLLFDADHHLEDRIIAEQFFN